MKNRIIILLIILSFFFLYIEWGGNNQAFVWQMIGDIFKSGKSSFSHPLVLLPFIGIVGLLYCFIKTTYSKKILWISLSLISILVLMILLIAILTLNLSMLISPVLIVILIFYLLYTIRMKKINE